MSGRASAHSRGERRRDEISHSERRSRRRRHASRSRSGSHRGRRRRTNASQRDRDRGVRDSDRELRENEQRSQKEQRERELKEKREERERERLKKEPSETVLVNDIPEEGVTEERLEAAAWEAAVQAGCSMPNGVNFAYDRHTHQFRGFAILQFPHKEASKLFMESTSGKLSIDGVSVSLMFHNPDGAAAFRSRSLSGAGERNRGIDSDPSCTLIIKGISSSTLESVIARTFQAWATIKDIRHFPRRGFAFVQFHAVEDATVALSRFERECHSKLEGQRVFAHFAKDREDGRFSAAERGFLAKQAMATAEAAAELDKIAQMQVTEENTTKALSGVNAEMWASYMQSLAQTETVESANTFELQKDTGHYLDAKAGLFYDPVTTYFFTTDYKKYFIYCHDEKMLCLVDSDGQKVPDGERRPLPSQEKDKSGKGREAPANSTPRSTGADGRRGDPSLREEVRRASSERRDRRGRSQRRSATERSMSERGNRRDRDHDRDRDRDRQKAAPPVPAAPASATAPLSSVAVGPAMEQSGGEHQPIHFPGGDPLAKLAPARNQDSSAAKDAAKKKRRATEEVLGLAVFPSMVAGAAPVLPARPGPVTVFGPGGRMPTGRAPTGRASTAACVAAAPPSRVSAAMGMPSSAALSGIATSVAALSGGAATPFLGQLPVSAFASPALGNPNVEAANSPTTDTAIGGSFTGIVGGAASLVPENIVEAAALVHDWICEICMRKFSSEEQLRRHEDKSELHKQNLAKLHADL